MDARRYRPDDVIAGAVTPPAIRCMQVWVIPKELLVALNWSVVEAKRRWVLICALQGSASNPSHAFLMERTTQGKAVQKFKPPRRLSVVDPDDGLTIHYVFAAGRFRRIGVNRMRRWMEPAPTKDLPAKHWQAVKEGVEAAPPRWQPVREAWASGGCPKPDSP